MTTEAPFLTAAFLTDLVLRDDGTGVTFTLERDLIYRSMLTWPRLVVPRLFRTDFASVPRGLWNVLPRVGPWDKASVLHDWLYATQDHPRSLADAVFNEAMRVCGVPTWKRWAMYLAVRVGGAKAWRADGERKHPGPYVVIDE